MAIITQECNGTVRFRRRCHPDPGAWIPDLVRNDDIVKVLLPADRDISPLTY